MGGDKSEKQKKGLRPNPAANTTAHLLNSGLMQR